MVKPIRKSSNKNPPILSHEFIIQNHADIVSCVAMVFIIGLMVQATSPVASIFIALQHNVTQAGEVPLYTSGAKDWAAVFFYSLICIVFHDIIQQYALDKVSKKLHLSKSKLAVFSSSGQLTIFYLISLVWGIDVLLRERLLQEISALWANYPQPMPFLLKLFLLIQLAYRLHELPELYFQRTKKEEYVSKASKSLLWIALIAIPYFLNFNRLLVCLIVVHYISDFVYHISLLIQTVDKEEKFTKATRTVSNLLLVLSRLGSIIISVLTLWYGLALGEQQELDFQAGYYNIPAVRVGVLGASLVLQLILTYIVITRELERSQESGSYTTVTKARPQKKDKSKKSKRSSVEESDLPEVDQNTNKNLRNRPQKAK